MTMQAEEEIFNEYITLMRKLFNTGELTESEWSRRFALHQMIADIGSRRGELHRLNEQRRLDKLDDDIRKDAHPYE